MCASVFVCESLLENERQLINDLIETKECIIECLCIAYAAENDNFGNKEKVMCL